MSDQLKLYRPPVPGTLRLTLVATLVAGSALAFYRQDPAVRPVAIAAAALALLLIVWWRGTFVTDILGRAVKMLTRRLTGRGPAEVPEIARAGVDARTSVVLEVDTPESGEKLPVDLLARYLDRYGISCSSIRVTDLAVDGHRGKTWVTLTLSAADNLTALQARSPRIPLRDTAKNLARRLADHLRELGWQVRTADDPQRPVHSIVTEGWRGVHDDHGYLAAYRASIDHGLAETLRAVRNAPQAERWTALELTGTPDAPALTVVCALRTGEKPTVGGPFGGLAPCWGEHLRVLQTLDPLSTEVFGGATGVSARYLDELAQHSGASQQV